jgi:hypothetical protein
MYLAYYSSEVLKMVASDIVSKASAFSLAEERQVLVVTGWLKHRHLGSIAYSSSGLCNKTLGIPSKAIIVCLSWNKVELLVQ